jgi:hypothetical protein
MKGELTTYSFFSGTSGSDKFLFSVDGNYPCICRSCVAGLPKIFIIASVLATRDNITHFQKLSRTLRARDLQFFGVLRRKMNLHHNKSQHLSNV